MPNFSIGTQIKRELEDFSSSTVKLAYPKGNETVRFIRNDTAGYFFNQRDTIALIDLYWNSKFDDGQRDKLQQRKIFMNIGKFRTEVASKQIDIDVKDFRFLSDDYADPWTAIFLQKDFKEWAKENYFGELLNRCVDALPRYGTVVLKKVGKTVEFVPLQLLRNEQTADSLDEASHVIEIHPDMQYYELTSMKEWDLNGLKMNWEEKIDVYERYGHVPRKWLNAVNKDNAEYIPVEADDTVDALVIMALKKSKEGKNEPHLFFAGEITERPYREVHWNRQYGRWLGVGVMEDLFENQVAKNIIVNLIRRSLHWSSKRILQSPNTDATTKNLVMDVPDGTVLEVGRDGLIQPVDLTSKSNAEFSQFLNEFERNADQKAFTYEVSTGENLPSGTPFRLGVILQNSVNAYFALKREYLGLFLKRMMQEFMIPQFLRDMGNKEKVIAMFGDESGFEALKEAAMQYVKSEVIRISLLSGNPVDPLDVEQAVDPFQAVKTLFFTLPQNAYKDAKYKFDLTVTGEEVNVEAKLETLKALYFSMIQTGDPRAEKVLERITGLAGENIAIFGNTGAPSMKTGANVNPSGANGGGNPGGTNTVPSANASPSGARKGFA